MDLSIIIPTHNRLWSLPRTIASCPRRENIEIVVVDDGSTDGTWEWLRKQPGLVAIRQPNRGKPAAVNAGVSASTGRYIRFLDSDDLLVEAAACRQLDHALRDGPDICVAGYEALYTATGRTILHKWEDCGDFVAQQLGECDSSHYSAYIFARTFVSDIWHRPEFSFRDDRMFVLECALKSPSVTSWHEPTLVHQHHDRPRIQFQPGSVAIVTNWQELGMFKQIVGRLEEKGDLTDRRRAAVANNIWPLTRRIAAYNRREARDAFRWLQRVYPAFAIPRHGLNRLYRLLGIPVAQTIVNTARSSRNGWRSITEAIGGTTGQA